jgi:hypothetical protein
MKRIPLAASAVIASCVHLGAGEADLDPSRGGPAPPSPDRAFISFRIGVPRWMTEAHFREPLALFEKYRGVTDEISLFTSATHPPLPLDVIRERARVAALRMAQARELGYRAGINVLATMGHHEENLPRSLSGGFTPVTDIDGNTCRGSFCPNDPRLQEYIREVYRAVASAGPDFIWIDDDVRLAGHMPVFLTCFCDGCRAILSGGVFLDAQALARLAALGLADLTGFDADRILPADCIERLVEHPLNAPFAGRERDCRQSFYHQAAHTLKRREAKAEVLSKIVDYGGEEVAPCVAGIFENRLGGRVCVAGYFPWTYLHSLSKSSQMKSVMRGLSRDRLPAYVASFHKIHLWAREPDGAGTVLALTNSSFDPAQDVSLMIRTDKEWARVFDMRCAETRPGRLGRARGGAGTGAVRMHAPAGFRVPSAPGDRGPSMESRSARGSMHGKRSPAAGESTSDQQLP